MQNWRQRSIPDKQNSSVSVGSAPTPFCRGRGSALVTPLKTPSFNWASLEIDALFDILELPLTEEGLEIPNFSEE